MVKWGHPMINHESEPFHHLSWQVYSKNSSTNLLDGENGKELNFSSISRHDRGYYQCKVQTDFYTLFSGVAYVEVGFIDSIYVTDIRCNMIVQKKSVKCRFEFLLSKLRTMEAIYHFNLCIYPNSGLVSPFSKCWCSLVSTAGKLFRWTSCSSYSWKKDGTSLCGTVFLALCNCSKFTCCRRLLVNFPSIQTILIHAANVKCSVLRYMYSNPKTTRVTAIRIFITPRKGSN